MALISKIRQNSWLLIVVIGLALAAFILMDMTAGGGRQGAGDLTMGAVNGQAIDYREFQQTETTLYSGGGGNTYANRNFLWNYFVDKNIVEQMQDRLGIGVSRDELMELQFGSRLSPIIQQRFADPNTGQVDRQTLNSMRSSIENGTMLPEQRNYWSVQEKEIVVNSTQAKVNNLVAKTIYTPGWMADIRNEEQKKTINADVVRIPYTAIDDQEVTVTDADMETWLKENGAAYEQDEESRVAEYAIFDVIATKEDSMAISDRMADLKTRLSEAADDSLFVLNQGGVYPVQYYKPDEIQPPLSEVMNDLEVGDLYGPYVANGQYQVIKLIDRKAIPDSVRARHILRPVQTEQEFVAANTLLDSLIRVINNGSTTFEEAAAVFGTDATMTKGGDLGFTSPGRMVQPFNDLIFYRAEPGKLEKVGTQFGLHLVEVTDRKYITNENGVRFATLGEDIIPSEETQNDAFNHAFDLIGQQRNLDELRQAVEAEGKTMATTFSLRQNDFSFPVIQQSNTSREIIRWLFTPGIEVGDVSPEVHIYQDPNLYYNSKLILVGLHAIADGNYPHLSTLRQQIEPLVRNKKKAAMIMEAVEGQSMEAAAGQYDLAVQQATDINLASGALSGIGAAQAVVGEMFRAAEGESVGPIEGADGVYFFRVTSVTEATPITDLSASRRIYSSLTRNQVGQKLWPAIRQGCEIEDNRSTYY